jgi:hypothetical protein
MGLVFILLIPACFIIYFAIDNRDSARYKVIAESGREYYCDTFRVYGKGVVFDDIYKRTVIVQGDLEILTNREKE